MKYYLAMNKSDIMNFSDIWRDLWEFLLSKIT